MPANEPTRTEVGHALAVFGNYRVLRSQQLTEAKGSFPHASILMSLGLRESGLANICGGAVFRKWRLGTPRLQIGGCFQISDEVAADWLKDGAGMSRRANGLQRMIILPLTLTSAPVSPMPQNTRFASFTNTAIRAFKAGR